MCLAWQKGEIKMAENGKLALDFKARLPYGKKIALS